ncbi:MAG: hypothetical protein IK000_02840 [Bacteroidaceae bacterium]|nr:hypothetical protein [Bacteroidaceae bacterium]
MKSKDDLPKRIIEPYPRQSKAAFDKERIIFLLAFTLLCFCCLFADGLPVLDSHIRSKWFGMLFFSAVLGLSIPFFHNIESFYFRSSDLVFSFLVLYIAVRSFERGSPMYGLQMLSVVLLYLSFRAVGQYCIKELFAVISAFTVLLALWGICQSVHILPGGNDGFSAIGNFDNPAGYASALAIDSRQ